MKKVITGLVIGIFFFSFIQMVEATTMTISMVDGSPTWDSETNNLGFVSTSNDPLALFNGESVHFRGRYVGGQYLVYDYRLDFDNLVNISSIVIEGAAWGWTGYSDYIQLLDSDKNVIGSSFETGSGNYFDSFQLNFTDAIGQTFYLQEYNWDTFWRYRSNIEISFSDAAPVPEPSTMLLLGTGLAWMAISRRKKEA